MLEWNANFQIPLSGVQSAWVFLCAEIVDDNVEMTFYADKEKNNLLWTKTIQYFQEMGDIYEYLMQQDEYALYKRVK